MLNMSKYQSKIIKVDSSSATSYNNQYNTMFLYSFDQIAIDQDHSFIFSLQNFVCPYTFYGVNRYNQYLDVRQTVGNVSIDRTIVIPAGNYNAYDFATTLQTLLNADNSNITYQISYLKTQNRFKLTNTTVNATALFRFLSGPNNNEACYTLLGFDKQDITLNYGFPLLSTICASMNDIFYLQLKTNLDNNITLSSNGTDGILQIIPINSQPFGFITYEIEDNTKKFLLPQKTISNIEVSLTDNYDRPINLNGKPFYFTIKIDIIRNDDFQIPYSKDARQESNSMQTQADLNNLQYLNNNPENLILPTPTEPINLSDMLDYLNLQKMIQKQNNKKKKSKSTV